MTWSLTQPDPRMSKLILSLFPVEPTGKGLRSFDILGSGCVSSMYGSSVQPIPNKSYETLHREALTDPSLKNITTFVTAITASPLWEGWKMQPDINAGKTVGNTHSRRDQAQSRLNVFGALGLPG